jgi:hypothetical protein
MVTGIKNTRTASPSSPSSLPPGGVNGAPNGASDGPVDDTPGSGPAETDLAARRRAIDSAAAAITDEMQGTIVTDAEANDAVVALQALPAGDARLALDLLVENGALETLADNVDGASRRALVDVMIAAGFVHSEAGRLRGPTTTGPQPPTPPTFASVDGVYGAAARAMLHEENIARLDGFRDAFDAYRADYQQAVRDAPSFPALRALGPIAEPTMPLREPGTHGDVPHEWAKRAGTAPDVETGRILTDTIYRLNGQSPPGVDLTLESTVKLGFFEQSEKVTLERSGAVARETKTKFNAHIVEHETKTTTRDGKSATSTEMAFGVDAKGNKLMAGPGGVELGLDAAGMKGKLKVAEDELVVGGGARDMGLEVSVKESTDDRGHARTTAKVKGEVEGLTATAGIDSDGGMIVGVGIDSDHLEAQLELTTQLVSQADYARAFAAIDGDVFSNPPPELARGEKWSRLGDDAQAAYAFYGWTRESWDGRLKQGAQLASARVGGR